MPPTRWTQSRSKARAGPTRGRCGLGRLSGLISRSRERPMNRLAASNRREDSVGLFGPQQEIGIAPHDVVERDDFPEREPEMLVGIAPRKARRHPRQDFQVYL